MSQGRRSDDAAPAPELERSHDQASVDQEYDALLAGFATGDHGRAELAAGEQRTAVRRRLQAAARRRDLALHFRPGPGRALIFRVEIAEPKRAPAPAARPARSAHPAAPQRPSAREVASPPPALADRPSARPAPSPPDDRRRAPDDRRPAAERYRSVLPRWMRDSRPAGQRRDGKNGRRSK